MSQYSNQGNQGQGSSDEIDLREAFKAIGEFFARIGRGVLNFLLATRRATRSHRILILVTVVLFIGLGFLWHSNGREYFSSSMVIESEYYDRDLMDGAVGELNALAEQGAYSSLGKKLNISEEEASNLRSLKMEVIMAEDDKMLLDAYLKSLQESKMTVDELVAIREKLINENAKYRLTIEVFSNEMLQNMQDGLVYYLENNEYVERRIEIEMQNLQALRGKLQQERGKLDVLKNLIAENFNQANEKGRTGSNNVIFGTAESATDPLNVYREDIKLYNEELAINKKLALMENVEVIKSFTAFKKPANMSLLSLVALSALIGLGAAYVLVILLEANKALNRYEKREQLRKELVA